MKSGSLFNKLWNMIPEKYNMDIVDTSLVRKSMAMTLTAIAMLKDLGLTEEFAIKYKKFLEDIERSYIRK